MRISNSHSATLDPEKDLAEHIASEDGAAPNRDSNDNSFKDSMLLCLARSLRKNEQTYHWTVAGFPSVSRVPSVVKIFCSGIDFRTSGRVGAKAFAD